MNKEEILNEVLEQKLKPIKEEITVIKDSINIIKNIYYIKKK